METTHRAPVIILLPKKHMAVDWIGIAISDIVSLWNNQGDQVGIIQNELWGYLCSIDTMMQYEYVVIVAPGMTPWGLFYLESYRKLR